MPIPSLTSGAIFVLTATFICASLLLSQSELSSPRVSCQLCVRPRFLPRASVPQFELSQSQEDWQEHCQSQPEENYPAPTVQVTCHEAFIYIERQEGKGDNAHP